MSVTFCNTGPSDSCPLVTEHNLLDLFKLTSIVGIGYAPLSRDMDFTFFVP
jgi:hypothetical protein